MFLNGILIFGLYSLYNSAFSCHFVPSFFHFQYPLVIMILISLVTIMLSIINVVFFFIWGQLKKNTFFVVFFFKWLHLNTDLNFIYYSLQIPVATAGKPIRDLLPWLENSKPRVARILKWVANQQSFTSLSCNSAQDRLCSFLVQTFSLTLVGSELVWFHISF